MSRLSLSKLCCLTRGKQDWFIPKGKNRSVIKNKLVLINFRALKWNSFLVKYLNLSKRTNKRRTWTSNTSPNNACCSENEVTESLVGCILIPWMVIYTILQFFALNLNKVSTMAEQLFSAISPFVIYFVDPTSSLLCEVFYDESI